MSSPNSTPPQNRANGPPPILINSGNTDLLSGDSPLQPQSSYGHDKSRQLMPEQRNLRPVMRQQQTSDTLHQISPSNGDSSDLLLPPNRSRMRRFRDEESPRPSPLASEFPSRRTSWSEESSMSHDSRAIGPFASPFDDSRSPSRTGTDDENVNTQTVSEKYNILPSSGLLLFPEDVEKDDWLHNPDIKDMDTRRCDIFHRRPLANLAGLIFLCLGLLALFIAYPLLTFIEDRINPDGGACSRNPLCIDVGPIPLLKGVRRDLIDEDTPDDVRTRKTAKGKTQKLVFSDEFNKPGRTFYDEDDAYFQGVDIWYGVTMDLEWYDPDAITTKDGVLEIRFDAFQNHGLNYRSGMLQSWNKFCFKGGYIEASISLPGRGDISGFWPGFWTMGNLGRPGYASSTDGMWPYSYHHECDAGITKNQSDPDGLSYLPGLRLPACTCKGEDHPNPGKTRSAPELDALEASVEFLGPGSTRGIGSVSQSLQVAPFDIFYRPDYDFMEIYDYGVTGMNSYCGGVFQQALSGITHLNNNWYDGKQYQIYAFEYEPGEEGYVSWYVGKELTWSVDAKSIGPNGNIGQRTMPEEPMTIIANFGMSNGFATVDLAGLAPLMPATMRLDYIRIYQGEGDEILTCDPPGYPTTQYIKDHPEAYQNPNLTLWKQTPYDWPLNSFVDDCEED